MHPLAQVPGIATPLDQVAVGDAAALQASLALAQQQAQQTALVQQSMVAAPAAAAAATATPQATTPCFMLSNMFDPTR